MSLWVPAHTLILSSAFQQAARAYLGLVSFFVVKPCVVDRFQRLTCDFQHRIT